MSKNRIIASLISNDTSKVKSVYTDSDNIVTSASLGVNAAAGTTTYSSADTLPTSATNGDQALVTSTNRLYIYSGSGWYNIALINTTPYWSTEASSSYDLSKTGASTVITILAVDSEGVPITYTATTDSDFDNIATITKDSDNGRTFTVVPTDSENGTAIAGTGTVTFKASDGVNLVSTLSTFTITFQVTNSNYTTLLIKADSDGTDNQVDIGSIGLTITENGSVTSTAFSPYHPGGYSVYFDGTDDYITVADSTDFDFGTGDFTMEGWYYATDVSGDRYILNFTTSAGNGHFGVNFYNGGWRVGLFNGSLITGTTGIEVNAWHHFAWVRESGTMKFYIDGAQVGSDVSYSSALDCSGTFRIGTYAATPTYGEYLGYLRDIRIVKGTAVYTSAFTSPTERLTAIANTTLLACHLPYIADGSTSDHTLTISGNTSTARFSPYNFLPYNKTDYGGSLYIPSGSSHYLVLGSNDLRNLGNSDWTLEAWCYPMDNALTSYKTLSTRQSSSNNGYEFFIYHATNGWGLEGYGSNNNTSGQINSSTFRQPKTWYHVAYVNSTTDTKIYINGKLDTTYANSKPWTSATDIRVGYSEYPEDAGPIYITDLRFTRSQVYTAAFTPPTAPLTAGSAELFTFTNKSKFSDTATGMPVMTTGGSVTTSTSEVAYPGTSIYFSTRSDEISGNGTLAPFNTLPGDFTIELECKLTSSTMAYAFVLYLYGGGNSDNGIIRFGDSGYGYHLQFIINNGGGTGAVYNVNLVQSDFTSGFRHIAWTREGGVNRVFIDGTQYNVATGTNPSTFSNASWTDSTTINFNNSDGIRISQASYAPLGYLQNIRITNGLARYTSNFTAPTSEFKG